MLFNFSTTFAIFLLMLTNPDTALTLFSGERCLENCTEPRGYIAYKTNQSDVDTWNIQSPSLRPTSFVLHLKTVQKFDQSTLPWLRITVYQAGKIKNYIQVNDEEKIYAFNDTYKITLSVSRQENVHLVLNYYVGCTILQGKEVALNKKRQKLDNVDLLNVLLGRKPSPICYFIFPVTREQVIYRAFERYYRNRGWAAFKPRTDIRVKESFFTLNDLELPSRAEITLRDVISDDLLLRANETEKFLLATSESNNNLISYVGDYKIASAYFLDVQCADDIACKQTKFGFTTYGLKKNDVNCIERERKCKFNVGQGNYSCKPLSADPQQALMRVAGNDLLRTRCNSFNQLSERLMIDQNRDTIPTPRSQGSKFRFFEMARRRCTDYKGYCNRKCNAKRFRRKRCNYFCYYTKKVLKICGTPTIF